MTTLPPVAGVIGWPVAHSKSPRMHRFWLRKLGIDGDYSRFPVHPDNLAAAIRALPALGLRGVNLTVPHKTAVLSLLDRISPEAAAVGAVNTVTVEGKALVGTNTDVAGVLEPLTGVALENAHAMVIGAGGAARAVLAALTQRRIGTVTLLNRSRDTAEALLAEFKLRGSVYGFDTVPEAAAVVINASSLGMTGYPPLPFEVAALAPETLVYDLVYAPLDTPLLQAARAHGLPTVDGLTMLIGQGAAAFELFYGQPAPRQYDAELRAVLTA